MLDNMEKAKNKGKKIKQKNSFDMSDDDSSQDIQ